MAVSAWPTRYSPSPLRQTSHTAAASVLLLFRSACSSKGCKKHNKGYKSTTKVAKAHHHHSFSSTRQQKHHYATYSKAQ